MQNLRWLVLLVVFVSPWTINEATGGWSDVLDKAVDTFGGEEQLDNTEIVNGLKEALEVGSAQAVQLAGRENGYFNHPRIKIPLPDAIAKTEKLVRAAGMGDQLDAFVLSMNRAAEQAAPEARAIFWEAIQQMQFDDAKRILNGRKNEATLYFQDKTSDELTEVFKPLVHQSMEDVGVTQQYQSLQESAAAIPFLSDWLVDLDDYVTSEALEGLFFLMAEEEAKIRQDPAARVTDLLQKVFANP
ncbi:MAG: DUF4197 domain-containing protein [Desulfobacterales bacterium]